jgi:hypothetical protein
MLNELKMQRAHEMLARAIWWDEHLPPTSSTRYSKVSMLLNQACKLELEALGFIVYHFSFAGPKLGEIVSILKGPIYPDGVTPIPYRYSKSKGGIIHPSEPSAMLH